MGEVLPDGRIQGYFMICWQCSATVPVNIMGQGTCPRCGAKLPKPGDDGVRWKDHRNVEVTSGFVGDRHKTSESVEEEMRRRAELKKEGLHEGGNHHQGPTTICLFNGGAIDFLDPDYTQIRLDDIARGLAYTCRFFGQTRRMLTVAEHSRLVYELYRILYPDATDEELQYALCHDAHESLISDIGSPLKRALEALAGKPIIKMLDELIEPVVLKALGLKPPSPEVADRVKRCDLRARFCEGHALCPEERCWVGPDSELPPELRDWEFGLEPEVAKQVWLDACHDMNIGGALS